MGKDATAAPAVTESAEPVESAGPGAAKGWLAAERSFAAICLVIAAFIGLRAESLVSKSNIPRDGSFPPHALLMLGSAVLGLASMAWLWQVRRAASAAESTAEGTVREALVVFSILLVGSFLAGWLGLLAAAGVSYVAVLLYYRERSRLFIFGSCAAYLTVLHFGVEVLMRVPLPRSPYLPLPF